MIPAYQMKRPWLGLTLLAAFATGGCSHPAPAESQAAQAPVVDTLPQRRDADDTARFLAGMPGKPGSPYTALESNPAWQQHREVLDKAWGGTETSLIAGLAEFQKQELAGAPINAAPVFYPFGGPDALTPEEVTAAVGKRLTSLTDKYPGLTLEERPSGIHVIIPDSFRTSHQEHYGEVARRFFGFLKNPKSLPAWEKPNMLAKYWVTTKGAELSKQGPPKVAERIAPK